MVKERSTKECFPANIALADMIVARCMDSGLVLYPGKGTVSQSYALASRGILKIYRHRQFDGVNGDHVIIAPPYIITEVELDLIVAILEAAMGSAIYSIL